MGGYYYYFLYKNGDKYFVVCRFNWDLSQTSHRYYYYFLYKNGDKYVVVCRFNWGHKRAISKKYPFILIPQVGSIVHLRENFNPNYCGRIFSETSFFHSTAYIRIFAYLL